MDLQKKCEICDTQNRADARECSACINPFSLPRSPKRERPTSQSAELSLPEPLSTRPKTVSSFGSSTPGFGSSHSSMSGLSLPGLLPVVENTEIHRPTKRDEMNEYNSSLKPRLVDTGRPIKIMGEGPRTGFGRPITTEETDVLKPFAVRANERIDAIRELVGRIYSDRMRSGVGEPAFSRLPPISFPLSSSSSAVVLKSQKEIINEGLELARLDEPVEGRINNLLFEYTHLYNILVRERDLRSRIASSSLSINGLTANENEWLRICIVQINSLLKRIKRIKIYKIYRKIENEKRRINSSLAIILKRYIELSHYLTDVVDAENHVPDMIDSLDKTIELDERALSLLIAEYSAPDVSVETFEQALLNETRRNIQELYTKLSLPRTTREGIIGLLHAVDVANLDEIGLARIIADYTVPQSKVDEKLLKEAETSMERLRKKPIDLQSHAPRSSLITITEDELNNFAERLDNSNKVMDESANRVLGIFQSNGIDYKKLLSGLISGKVTNDAVKEYLRKFGINYVKKLSGGYKYNTSFYFNHCF